ncbi:phosphopyruvate hydratase [Paraburkholderia domus]|uniref:phosphopyruvate hydratase n=1 Tax=Paraburkholderia domus TaxID=2793075 RepID=UPI001AFF677F|nr:phosphopyruvate hydratase [Paraburkholderia domus]CAE6841787.1 Enolase 2 [Paraburkholderia domus]
MKTAISKITSRRIWDSRGRPTVEVDVELANGIGGRGIAPAGASRGSNEAIDLRDGGSLLAGFGVQRALSNVDEIIAPALLGMDAMDQAAVDAILIALDGTPNKARLGGNATIATSMAVLNAAAAAAGMPLWRYLAGNQAVRLPLPEIQIFGGGAHAGRRTDIQDFLVMPLGAQSFDEALFMVAEVYRAAGDLMASLGRRAGVADEGGWWPDFTSNEEALEMLTRSIERAGYRHDQVAISLDIAASEFGRNGRYKPALESREFDTSEWLELMFGWLKRYPIVSVEDPVAEDDPEGMRAFTEAVGDSVQVIGDDFLVTSADRVNAAAARGQCNAVLLKPNQAGTITETYRTMEAAKKLGWGMIVSARSGESEDTTIVHLATGWNTGQLKVGSFSRSERMAKWNEGLRIEEQIGRSARFAGWSALPARSLA